MDTVGIEEQYGLSVCKRQELVIERGEGNWVWDQTGRRYLDFTAGWGVTCLGHAHPVILEALSNQAGKIIQNPNSGFTYSPARAALLLRLQALLPEGLSRIYFASSGAEANDAAVKLARKVTGRSEVIAAKKSFHGRTLSTLSLSGGAETGNSFLPVVSGNKFVEYGNLQALAALISERTAAVILEPVQGEGGVRIPPPGYLKTVAELCRATGSLLIIDEVQTGFCRTGKFFAIDEEQIEADILTMGKGIAGGLPFAAFAMTEKGAAGVQKGDHGGTYCGNPLVCAVSDAVVKFLVDNRIADKVWDTGNQALKSLQQLAEKYPSLIHNVRGKGLMLALDVGDDDGVAAITQACMRHGLLVTPTRNGVVRLLPGLLLNIAELDEGMQRLDLALADVACTPESRSCATGSGC